MNANIPRVSAASKNFLFLGGAGSGKSECSVNFALRLAEAANRPVHFFDLDMTKPLFRSRDLAERLEAAGIVFHCQQQFMDAPTQVGGVQRLLRDESVYTVLDVGGDDIGARAIGGYANFLNREDTTAFYVLNVYRPWTSDIEKVDETLGKILGVSHIRLDRIQFISNPNLGPDTTIDEFLEGCRLTKERLAPYCHPEMTCVREDLLQKVAESTDEPLFPLHINFSEPWLGLEPIMKEGA